MARWLLPVGLLLPSVAWAADGGGSPVPLLLGLGVILAGCAALVATRRAEGLLVSALAGAVISAYLGWEHEHPDPTALCNIDETFNCSLVNTSRWSEVLGIPIGFLGLGYFLGMATLAWRARQVPESHAAAVLFAGAVLATGYDLFLVWATVELGAVCLFCSTTWALNLILLVGAALSARGKSFVKALSTELGAPVVVGLAAVVAGVVVLGAPAQGGGSAPRRGGAVDWLSIYEEPAGVVELSPADPSYGDPNARFTLLEYADFECPYCGYMNEPLHSIPAEHPDVRLVFKNYPLAQTCNRFLPDNRHPDACNAAAAGECAWKQGRFWELARLMFKNQDYLGKEDVRFMAEQAGLDPAAFETCMADPATGALVVADVEAGGKAGISGTPTIFLHGAFGDRWVRVNGGKDELVLLIEAARAGQALPAPGPAREPR